MMLAADAVIVRGGKVLLVKRAGEPFRGKWALPGGMVEEGERAAEAAVREAREETGVEVRAVGLIGVFDAPGRDPRGRVVSVAYKCEFVGGEIKKGSEALDAKWFPLAGLPELGFDHANVLAASGVSRA